jgi:hypothetical protein
VTTFTSRQANLDDGSVALLKAEQRVRLDAAHAVPGDRRHAVLMAVDEIGREMTGHAHFTSMVFDEQTMTVRRIYSSNHDAYPIGGTKPKRDTPWGQHVLLERRIYIGENEAAIRDAFDDHELILSLGLRSIINVPVVVGPACHGTLNFLWKRPLRTRDVAVARALMITATPVFAEAS